MATETATATSLQVRRVIKAPRQRVFEAWTKPDELKRWHAPGRLTVSLAEIDARPGGKYRIHMQQPDGVEHKVSGVYREVDPPKRLVYTWGWDGNHPVKNSVVTIDFVERGNATEVILTHDGFPSTEERDDHEKGWTAILEKLEAAF